MNSTLPLEQAGLISNFAPLCLKKAIIFKDLWVYVLNFESISPRASEIKAFDRQTDGQQNDLIRVPLFLNRYGTLKKDTDQASVLIWFY